MRVLITGANGLLGRVLCTQLLQQGVLVYGLTHTPPIHPITGIKYLSIDFAQDWLEQQLPDQIDSIIHLSQSAKFRDFPDSALDVFKVNVESTARLLDYAKRIGARQFIYASSGGVYGNGSQAFKENAPIIPSEQLGHYLGSKMCGEILAQSYSSLMTVTILRPFFIYGPGQNRSMLLPRLFDRVVNKVPIQLQGKNGILINPIHVMDAAQAVVAALLKPQSTVFNIAGPDVLSIRQIGDAIGQHLGTPPVYELIDTEPKDLIADNLLMAETLHKPAHHFVDQVRDLAPL